MKISNASSTAIHGIRLLSAQAVLVGHALVFFSLYPKNIPYIQSIAVTVLFILSGFLTVYSYDNKKQKNPQYRFKDFLIDRFSRIYSAYLPAIIFVVLLDWPMIRFSVGQYDFSNQFNVKTIFANIFMLQDFPLDYYLPGLSLRVSESLGSARPFWTLPIEWWLYMWFGIFIVEYKFSKNRIWFWVVGLFSSLVPIYNVLAGRGNGLSVSFILAGLLYYVIKWVLGQEKANTETFIKTYKKEYFIAVVSLVVLAAFRVNEVSNTWRIDYGPYYDNIPGCRIWIDFTFNTNERTISQHRCIRNNKSLILTLLFLILDALQRAVLDSGGI